MLKAIDMNIFSFLCSICFYLQRYRFYVCSVMWSSVRFLLFHNVTLDRRKSKTLLTIDERGSIINRNSVFDFPVTCYTTESLLGQDLPIPDLDHTTDLTARLSCQELACTYMRVYCLKGYQF